MGKKICRFLLYLLCILTLGMSIAEEQAAAAAKSTHKNELVREKGKK